MDKESQNRRRRRQRTGAGGVTLLELLVVITIMVLLAAAAVPVFAPALRNRQVREASRMVSSYITGARNRAMQTGRPVGIALDRLPGMNDACVSLTYVEVPPPYAGDSTGSQAVVLTNPNYSPAAPYEAVLVGFASGDIGWSGAVRPGDFIKLGQQGNTYRLLASSSNQLDAHGYFYYDFSQSAPSTGPSPAAPWYLQNVTAATGTIPPFMAPSGAGPFPPFNPQAGVSSQRSFQIMRAPVKTAAAGLQLPGPTVIDLSFSGYDIANNLLDTSTNAPISPWVTTYSFQPIWPRVGVTVNSSSCPFTSGVNDTSPIVITFNPSGSVDWVWCWPNGPTLLVAPQSPTVPGSNPVLVAQRPTTPIHLLIGRRELLPLPNNPPAITDPNNSSFQPYANWQDLTNFWVTINPQSGLITVVENAAAPISSNLQYSSSNAFGAFTDLMQARQLALQSMRTRGQ